MEPEIRTANPTKGLNMRSLKTMLATFVLTAIVNGAFAPCTFAGEADFKLKNKTGYVIDEVYVSPHSSGKWGKDIMGSDALSDGEAKNITFPHGGGECQFDIKVKYHDDDSTAEWGDINLCKYETISLYWNAKQQVTRAVGE